MTSTMLTPNDVAEKLKIKVATVYDYLTNGSLEGFKLGPEPEEGKKDRRPWRINGQSLDKFMGVDNDTERTETNSSVD